MKRVRKTELRTPCPNIIMTNERKSVSLLAFHSAPPSITSHMSQNFLLHLTDFSSSSVHSPLLLHIFKNLFLKITQVTYSFHSQ